MELAENKQKLAEYRRRAADLVAQMTLEEKVSQTLYESPAIARLGIKAYNWWNEALHGVARSGTATVFPQAIGLAATFDEDLLEEVGCAVSTEARGKFAMQQQHKDSDIYKGLTFWSPNVNIFRDPRWGRGHETFGEDPYLAGRLGVRYIKGLQGHDENYLKAAACAKHLAVHSGPERLRHQFNAVVSEQDLRETYLPAFEACVKEANVEAVMGAYNCVNGEPCCASGRLLQEILREEWGFQGHVVSDCWAINDIHDGHHRTSGPLESAALAMNHGCDLNCGTSFHFLVQAVRQGLVEEQRLDEAVTTLLTARIKLGVLDKKEDHPYDRIPYSVVDSRDMRRLNRRAAESSLVLLKNKDRILPLVKEKLHTIAVIGPNADNRNALIGNYEGTASRYVTVLEGIQDYVGEDVRVLYSLGCHLYKDRTSSLARANDREAEVRAVCAQSDVVIAVMGLDATLEGEEGDAGNEYGSGDKPDLNLPGLQHQIIRIAKESGKPVILILLAGSALAVGWEEQHVDAILQGWYPGAQGGHAIARALFGEVNPQGKLPVTFYRTTEELPDFEDYSMKGRTYRYLEHEPLFPFGYGLSYTTYTYRNLRFDEACGIAPKGPDIRDEACGIALKGLDICVEVENSGAREGIETVQIYIGVPGSDAPHPQLRAVRKVHLYPGERKEVRIHLEREAFLLYDREGKRVLRTGTYCIYAGGQQPDVRSRQLTGRDVARLDIKVNS